MEFNENFVKKLNKNCKANNTHTFYLSDFTQEVRLIRKLFKKLPKDKPLSSLKLDWTKEEMQKCALLFYKDLDVDLYFTIKDRLTDLKNLVEVKNASEENKKELSCVGFGSEYEKLFVQINPTDDVEGILVFVHEFAHLLPIRMKKLKPPKLFFISEVESAFCERLMIDYLHDNGVLDDNEYKNQINIYWNAFRKEAEWILQEDDIIRRYKLPYPATLTDLVELDKKAQNDKNYNMLMERLKLMTEGPKGNPVRHGSFAYKYVFGKVVAGELYEDFKKDKEQTLKRFKKFLRKSNSYDSSRQGRDEVLQDLFVDGKERFLLISKEK
ncbi:MAG: hypothetical protein J6J24_00205 [Clostridia bacterium]|nr:hypothetical protein [Clostridia bacterium]